jgi:hypothetical protein
MSEEQKENEKRLKPGKERNLQKKDIRDEGVCS